MLNETAPAANWNRRPPATPCRSSPAPEKTGCRRLGSGRIFALPAPNQKPQKGLARTQARTPKPSLLAGHNPVGWFEIYVQDLKRAQKFYEKLFAVKLQALPSPIIKMLAFPMGPKWPGCAGALVKMDGKESGGGGTLVYFSCADCAVQAARVGKLGGEIFKQKFSIGEFGFIALAVDTEGNLIGLHSMI